MFNNAKSIYFKGKEVKQITSDTTDSIKILTALEL